MLRRYVAGAAHEQAWFAQQLHSDAGFRAQVLARVSNPEGRPVSPVRRAALTALAHLGIAPMSLEFRARGFRRGRFIDFLRRERGLERLPPLNADVDALRRAEAAASAPYGLGAAIGFHAGGAAPRYQAHGWSYPEAWGTWTVGAEAGLTLNVDGDGDDMADLDLCLDGHFHAFVDPKWPRQRVEVLADGERVGEWVFSTADNHGFRTLRIPAGRRRRGEPLRLAFRMADAQSPAHLGLSGDARRLGLGVRSLCLRVEPAAAG